MKIWLCQPHHELIRDFSHHKDFPQTKVSHKVNQSAMQSVILSVSLELCQTVSQSVSQSVIYPFDPIVCFPLSYNILLSSVFLIIIIGICHLKCFAAAQGRHSCSSSTIIGEAVQNSFSQPSLWSHGDPGE